MTPDPRRARPAGRDSQGSGLAVASSPAGDNPDAAAEAVTWIYKAHLLSLARLAHVMLGDRAAAEDGRFTTLPAPRAVTVGWQYLFTAW